MNVEIELISQLNQLTSAKKRNGYELRPHKKLLRLILLAREHAAAVAFRPISFGNTSYFLERVNELKIIGVEIEKAAARLNGFWQSAARQIFCFIGKIDIKSTQKDIASVVAACDSTRYREFAEKELPYIPAGEFPIIKKEYKKLIIIAGPALGLGDEISSTKLINDFNKRFSSATIEIFSYYKGYWEISDIKADVYSLAGFPISAFNKIDKEIKAGNADKLLTVFINFSGLYFHHAYFFDKVKPDIIEIAIGRGSMWYLGNKAESVEVLNELDPLFPNNYQALINISQKLLGKTYVSGFYKEILKEKKESDVYKIVINPLTSKQIVLKPVDWCMLMKNSLQNITGDKKMKCIILPGLSENSAEYANNICDYLNSQKLKHFTSYVLNNGKPLNADKAVKKVYDVLSASDLLIGIDTYTAHLASQLNIPSIALCYERNIAFWSGSKKSFWLELRQTLYPITDLISFIVAVTGRIDHTKLHESLLAGVTNDIVKFENELNKFIKIKKNNLNEIVSAGDIIWGKLPDTIKSMLEEMDKNYSWNKISKLIKNSKYQNDKFLWLEKIINIIHFRKVCSLIREYNS